MNPLIHSLNVLASQGTTISRTDFCFAEPMWLWGLCVLPLLLLLRRRRGSAAAIQHPGIRFLADKLPTPTALAGAFGPLMLTLTAACILFALARPQWKEERHEPIASGIDIMITCDLSGSMTLEDADGVQRLTGAKKVIQEFVGKRPNDRIGLVAFSGKSRLCCPLTMDHEIVRQRVESFATTTYAEVNGQLHVRIPGTVLTPGTNISAAIATAATQLHKHRDSKSKIIVLFSDGDTQVDGIHPIDAAKQAAAMGIRIYTILIGEGTNASETYTKSASDTNMDARMMQDIARHGGGKYAHAIDNHALGRAFDTINDLEKTDSKPLTFFVYDELFYWPLVLACLLLMLYIGRRLVFPRSAP